MLWIILILSLLTALFSQVYSSQVDSKLYEAWGRLKELFFSRQSDILPELFLVARVQSQIRGGQSLDSALEALQRDPNLPTEWKERIHGILAGIPQRDFLSEFFAAALKIGAPILEPLAYIQKNLLVQQRLRLKAKSFSSQSRAQAEVLTWLPWALLFTLALFDWNWAITAVAKPISWIIWAFAILLTGLGKKWILHQIRKATEPSSKEEHLQQELLPDLTLRLLSLVSAGHDPQSALENALLAIQSNELNRCFSQSSPISSPELMHLKSILQSTMGSPVRSELLHLLESLQSLKESRWEEKVQRLPVFCLAPLFCCFFPSCLLVLLSLVLPMISELM